MDDFDFSEKYNALPDELKKINDSFSSFDVDAFDKSLDEINSSIKANTREIESMINPSKKKKGGVLGALHGIFNKK